MGRNEVAPKRDVLSKEWDNSEMLVVRHGMGATAWRTGGNNCRK